MAGGKAAVKGRKGKIGKNKSRISAYYSSGRNHWNKARRVAKHARRYGRMDASAQKALNSALAAMPLHMSREFHRQFNV